MDVLSNPAETPRADPHAGCCGGWGLDTPGYPIRLLTEQCHETARRERYRSCDVANGQLRWMRAQLPMHCACLARASISNDGAKV